MKKEIKLFFDFEFTSLSPDAQPISLGIISEAFTRSIKKGERLPFKEAIGNETAKAIEPSKSFYAEFSDFDLNRCDDWVRDNVVKKLYLFDAVNSNTIEKHPNVGNDYYSYLDVNSPDRLIFFHTNDSPKVSAARDCYINNIKAHGSLKDIAYMLKNWISQFSEYNIQFVCDCGTWDWYWMLQLLAEWEIKKELVFTEVEHYLKPEHLRHEDELKLFLEAKGREIIRAVDKLPKVNMGIKPDVLSASIQDNSAYYIVSKTGLPKLPKNISPVPQDLNDLIAYKKGMSVREAFDWNRLQFYFGLISGHSDSKKYEQAEREMKNIHNALFDANVIKAIYEKLK